MVEGSTGTMRCNAARRRRQALEEQDAGPTCHGPDAGRGSPATANVSLRDANADGDSSRNGQPGRVDGRRALTRRKLAGRHPGQEPNRIAEARWSATLLTAPAERDEKRDRLRRAPSRSRGEVLERGRLPRHESKNPGTSREAHGSIERPIGGNVDWTQRTRLVEQGLEVECSTRAHQAARLSPDVAVEVSANREQRREGNDHGDVERLQAREKLRRVWRHRGRTRASESH